MSGTERKSRVLSFGLSNPDKQQEGSGLGEVGGGAGGRMGSNRDDSVERSYSSSYEGVSQANQKNQSRYEPENKQQRKKEVEEDHEKSAPSVHAAMSEESGRQGNSPHGTYPYQQHQQHSGRSEGMARTFAAKGRAVNEVGLGPSYSHYPTSDTRTEEGEASYETNSLTGPGFSNRGSSGRGRIWETETYDDDRKGKDRPGGNRDLDFIRLQPTLVSTTASPTSFAQGREKEAVYQSSSPKRTSRSAELSVPVSKAREGEEDYSYSYSSTSAIATVHRSREEGSIAAASTSSYSSNTLSSVSRVEENSSTPSVPRARNESVSGSSSASAVPHVSMYRVPRNQYSSEPFSKRSPSPPNISDDYREDRRQQPWEGSTTTMSTNTRDSYRRDEAPQVRTPDRMGTSGADDPIHQSRSHVSRSPDRSYFQNTSARSGSGSTNAALLGTVAYQRQQELVKEPRQHYSETSYSSERPNYRTQSPLPPTYSHPRSRGADSVGTYPSLTELANFERQSSTRTKQNAHESRSLGRSTSSTPPSLENRDTLNQRVYTEYQRQGPPRQDDSRRLSTQEQDRHENVMVKQPIVPSVIHFDQSQQTEFAHSSSSTGRFGVSKTVRAQRASLDINANLPSKATSSYSTPSTTSISLSPALAKSLPSLRETFASPTTPSEPLPQSRNISTASSSIRPQTVSIPPAQITSRPTPGGPWLYDGEEPDLEEDEGFAAADEAGRPKKRRRTRVALSCAECKRRKIKCDRAQPCTPCARRGDQSNCKWAVMETKDGTPTRAEFEALQNRVGQLERLLFAVAPQLKQSP